MEKTESLIRHELLNILTNIQFLALEANISREKKEELAALIHRAHLLIAYQELLLGKKIKQTDVELNLKNLLEIIVLTHEEKILQKNIPIALPKEDFFIKADEQHLKVVLEEFLLTLLDSAQSIAFRWDAKKNGLMIETKGGTLPLLKKQDWKKSLKSNLDRAFELQLALHILELYHIRLEQDKNRIVLSWK